MTSYKTCAVPMCSSTTIKYPDKLFIHVPKCPRRRKQWLQLARRDPKCTSDKSAIFFCEDHFDLPNDMQNYMEYHLLGSVKRVLIKPTSFPSKFACQPHRRKKTTAAPRDADLKRQRKELVEQLLQDEKEKDNAGEVNEDYMLEKDEAIVIEDHLIAESTGFEDYVIEEALSEDCIIKETTVNKDYVLEEPQHEVRKAFICHECKKAISGFRYVCVQCVEYDCCGACEAGGAHASHYVLRVPGLRPHWEVRLVLEAVRGQLAAGANPPRSPPPHPTPRALEFEVYVCKEEIKDEPPDYLDDCTMHIKIEPPSPPPLTPATSNNTSPRPLTPATSNNTSPPPLTPAASNNTSPPPLTPATSNNTSPPPLIPATSNNTSPPPLTPAAKNNTSHPPLTPATSNNTSPPPLTPASSNKPKKELFMPRILSRTRSIQKRPHINEDVESRMRTSGDRYPKRKRVAETSELLSKSLPTASAGLSGAPSTGVYTGHTYLTRGTQRGHLLKSYIRSERKSQREHVLRKSLQTA